MRFGERFVVKPGQKVKLCRCDPGRTVGYRKKQNVEKMLNDNVCRLRELQYLLYAEKKRALLVILQGMDASGKDGTVTHVMGPVNPQGCRVTSFKVPSVEELDHDFLWRIHKAVPARGEIGIFNRSHYEDVLAVRVRKLVPRPVWCRRYRQINLFEEVLAENDVKILKFFLHISKGEQKKRLQERLDNPEKNWKVNPADYAERRLWDDYVEAYEDAIGKCSTKWAPWFIIPADKKWFRNLAVSQIIVETLEGMDMKFPPAPPGLSKIVLK